MTAVDVSILIVSHGHGALVRDCLSTIGAGMAGLTYEVILIDNLNEADFLAKVGGSRPEMTVVQNAERLGFGANVNKAARIADGRVLLILNPDTKYHAGRVADAVRFLEDDISIGVVAARLLNVDLTDQRNFRSFPSMWIAVLRGFGADDWRRRPAFYRRSLLEGVPLDGPTKVDWVYGSFMLIRKSVFEAFGGFDEGFYMYYEDVNLCFRLRKAGLSTFVYPGLEFVHHHLRTSSESATGSHRKYHVNSLARYLWKSNGFLTSPRMPGDAGVPGRRAAMAGGVPEAAANPLAIVVSPSSMRPLVPLAFLAAVAGSTVVAAAMAWSLVVAGGMAAGAMDRVTWLIAASYIACIIIAEFMLKEFDPTRLGDARARVIGVVESSIIAAFPVALFVVASGNLTDRKHELFLMMLVGVALLSNAATALVFARLISSEGARIGLVVDQASAAPPKAPELPIGLQIVSLIIPMGVVGMASVRNRIADAIRSQAIDHVLLVTGRTSGADALQLVHDLSMFDIPMWHAQVGEDNSVDLVQLKAQLRSRTREGLKRGFDLIFAVAALTVLFIPMLLIAAAIKLEDSGPVFFGQPRVGRNQVPFMMLKFRSMYASQADVRGDQLTARGDARITRVGAFLRRTSLDELPQFINVINGDMSIVGPRPLPIGFHFKGRPFENMIPNWHHRHRVRPGITGLSQLKGLRGTPEEIFEACEMMKLRAKYDNLYIDHWSIWMDFRIVIMTIISGAFMSSAY